MKGGTQAALVLGVGYVLGRRRKLRTATVVAAAAATGGVGSLGGAALKRGLKMLGTSKALGDLGPQVGELAEIVRGDLVGAGKAAALASVNSRIGSLSNTLRDRADLVRNPAAGAAETAGAAGAGAADAAGEAGDGAVGVTRRARRTAGSRDAGRRQAEPEDEYDSEPDDEYYDGEPESEDYEDEPDEENGDGGNGNAPLRRRAARRSPVSRARR